MDANISVNPPPPQRLEDTREEEEEGQNSLGALHKYNFFLLGMLGLLLQLKSGTIASPFVRNYVTVLMFTVDLFVYVASLATVKILDHQAAINDPDLSEFMDNVSLLSGTLASVLLLLILVPALGWLSLLLWAIYFVKDVVTVTSYTSVAVRAFDRVKEVVMMNQSDLSISSEEQNHVHQQEIRMEEGQNHVS
ncbi:unnamed protein product [Prunus brigantina]